MRQKTWKKRLALVLAASMTLNAGVMTSFARWEEDKESGKWYFYKDDDGTMVKGKVKQIQGKWYSFDDDGAMETDRLIEVDGTTFYITPGGEFAANKWMFLDGEGHKCTHTGGCECKWYRFGDIEEKDGQLIGGVVKDGLTQINGAWYSFDPETGVMRSDELIDGISEERPWEIFYAYEDGHLATQEWVQLNAEGHKVNRNSNDGYWYYFKNVSKGRGMVRDGEAEVQGKWYTFDENGHMILRDWVVAENGKKYYYQYSGERAVNKSLYIENEWYKFDEAGVATTSNAARKRVEKIEPVKTVVNAEVGKEVTLEFRLTEPAADKASTSDAMRNFTNDHDVWVDGEIEGRFLSGKTDISANGVCTITYKSDKENKAGDKILLVIDDVKAAEAVTVCTALPTDDKGNEITEDELAVSDIINTDKFEPGEETEAVKKLTTVYNESFDEQKKAAFENQWLEKPEQFDKLEKAYVESQRIETKTPEVAEGVKDKLSGTVSVAGAAFSAPAGSTVELKVDVPEENWEDQLDETFDNQAAFDISLFFDGNAQTEQLNMPVVITMPLPKGFEDATDATLKLFNIHGGESLPVKFRILVKGEIRFVTDKFSTYVFAMNDKITPTPPSGGYSGGRSSGGSRQASNNAIAGTLAGQWMQDGTGWWFRLDDGSYAVDSWQYVAYNGMAKWYRFDINGYICKGWFTDADGHRYYLNPVSDGQMGAMLTGWQQIDGIWYYFNTVSDGTQGALLVNTTTPDGYNVDANGQWIQ